MEGWTLKRRAHWAAVRRPDCSISTIPRSWWIGSLRLASPDPSCQPGFFQPCPGPFPDHGALELGVRTNHLHHYPACGRGGVDDLGETAEAHSPRAQVLGPH